MQDLFTAIYTHFTEDSDLAGSVSDLYNTEAPQNAVFPYIVFSLVSDTEDFDSDNYLEMRFVVYSNT